MATKLQKATKDLLFVGGVQEKADAKVFEPPLLSQLVNADMSRPGSVRKRRGFVTLATPTAPTGRLFPWGENSVGWFDDYKPFAKDIDAAASEPAEELVEYPDAGIDACTSIEEMMLPAQRETTASNQPDFAEVGGYRIVCNGWTAAVFHGSAIVDSHTFDLFIPYTGSQTYVIPGSYCCRAVGTLLICAYAVSGADNTLRWLVFDTATPSVGIATVATITDMTSTGHFDVIPVAGSSTDIFVVYNELSSGFAKLSRRVASSGALVAAAVSTAAGTNSVQVIQHSNGVVVSVGLSGTSLVTNAWTSVPAFVATSVLTATARATATKFVLAESQVTDSLRVYSLRNSGTTYADAATAHAQPLRILDWHEQPTSGAAGSLVASVYGVQAIWSRVVSVGDSDLFVASVDASTLVTGSTLCLLRVGRALAEETVGAIADWLRYAGPETADYAEVPPRPSNLQLCSDGLYRWIAASGQGLFNLDYAGLYSIATVGTYLCAFELGESRILRSSKTMLTSCGAYLERGSDYEQAPLTRPLITAITSAGANYSYVVVIEWFDENGDRHRSMPSEAATSTSNTADVTVAWPVLRSSGCVAKWDRIRVVLYQTELGGTVHHRGGLLGQPNLYGLPSAATFTITSNGVDATGEILYTETGQLENECPPSSYWVEEHNGRLWTIDENGQAWFTRDRVLDEAPAWNSTLVVDCSAHGVPTALVSEETSLVVFWAGRIGRIFGDGPNDAGQGAQFTAPQMLAGTNGCTNRRSIVRTPLGVMFQDPRDGLCVVPQGGPVQVIGQAVETTISSMTIRGAVHVKDKREARWYGYDGNGSGVAAVFHYETGAWSVHTLSFAPDDAIAIGNRVMLLDPDGSGVHIEKELDATKPWADTIADVVTGSVLGLTTGWIKLSGLQGFARIWDLYLLGERFSACNMTVSVFYDFDESTSDDFDIPFIADTVEVFHHRIRMRKQLATAIKVSVAVADADGEYSPTGQAVSLSGLRLVYGVDGRKVRVAQSRQGG